jgi:DNA-binding CsgD family transcriptional regulator
MSPRALRGEVLGQELSPSEKRTLRLAALGYGNKTVANIRGISANTVRIQLSIAYRKLGVHTLVEAMHRRGWVIIPEQDAPTRAELAREAVKLTAYSEAAGEAARILAEAADKIVDERGRAVREVSQ